MSGLPLFNIPDSPPKRVAETSKEAYREVQPSLKGKHFAVLNALASYIRWKEHEPTARELMEYMTISDPNEVRPRLTEMRDEEHGMKYVEASAFPRKCKVTGKTVHTWSITPRGEAFLRSKK